MLPVTSRIRRMLCILVAATTFLAFAGCASDDDPAQSGPTRTYQDASGATLTIPQRPTKIVTLSEVSLDGALALDVTPIGTTSARGQESTPDYLGARASAIPIVASSGGPNLQQILKLEPDLILVDDTTAAKNSVAELNKIAPTVFVGEYSDSWEKYFAALADILNRGTEHKRVVDEIDAQIATTKQLVTTHTPAGHPLTASVVRWASNGPTIVGAHSLSNWALTQVGLTRPVAQQTVDSQNRSGQHVSLENLDQIDADYIFFGALAGRAQAEKDLAAARSQPGFSELSAQKAGHVHAVDGVPWTSASGPLGLKVILTDITAAVG